MNIIITNVCNRSCPYCFAKHQVALGDAITDVNQYISIENINFIMDFLEKSNMKVLRLLGGEPTLHPDFSTIVNTAKKRGFTVNVFTNGIWSDTLRSYFREEGSDNVKFLFNINSPDIEPERNKKIIYESLELAGKNAKCGYNIYSENFDILFLRELIDRYSLERIIRIGLTAPIVGIENDFIPEEKMNAVGDRLADQLYELEKYNIIGAIDCGFTLCMFSEDKISKMFYSARRLESICEIIIDVGSDLKVWPCFPLNKLNKKYLHDFSNVQEIIKYFEGRLKAFRTFGSMDKCFSCKYLKRGQCSGGCIAKSIKKCYDNDDKKIIEKINMV